MKTLFSVYDSFLKACSFAHTESQWNPVESLSVYHISMSLSRLKADNWRLSSVRAAILSVAPSHCHPATINNSQAETPREAEGRWSCRKHRWKELRKHKMRTGTTDEWELEVWDEEGESNSIMNPGGEMRWAGGRRRSTCSLLQQAAINSSSNLPRKKKHSAAANPTQDGPKPHTCTP